MAAGFGGREGAGPESPGLQVTSLLVGILLGWGMAILPHQVSRTILRANSQAEGLQHLGLTNAAALPLQCDCNATEAAAVSPVACPPPAEQPQCPPFPSPLECPPLPSVPDCPPPPALLAPSPPPAPQSLPFSGEYIEARITQQLEEIQTICPSVAYVPCASEDRSGWSVANRTQASCHSATVGRFSYFKLLTFTAGGQRAQQGGDTWQLVLHHEATGSILVPRVFDEGDGSYLVTFLPHLPGRYTVQAWLYYSRCLGYQEMPREATTTDASGLATHKFEAEFIDYCYLGQQAALTPFEVVAAGAAEAPAAPEGGCAPRPVFVTRGPHGASSGSETSSSSSSPPGWGVSRTPAEAYRAERWVSWDGERPVYGSFHPPENTWPSGRNASRVVLAGDSTVVRCYVVLSAAKEQCTLMHAPHKWVSWDYKEEGSGLSAWCGNFSMPRLGAADPNDPEEAKAYRPVTLYPAFAKCRGAPLGQGSPTARKAVMQTNFKGFEKHSTLVDMSAPSPDPSALIVFYSDGFACQQPCSVWERTLKNVRPDDILIINIGLHCMLSVTYAQWQLAVDRFAAMLASLPSKHVYWRSMPLVYQHKSNGYHPYYHFFSDARRLVFDLYAEREMRRRGLRVIDISSLPANYTDFTHYDIIGNDMQGIALADAVC